MADEKTYSPQISVEKGVMEGTITTVAAAVVVGFMPKADPIEVATVIGAIIAIVKAGRNWWKNRKNGSAQ